MFGYSECSLTLMDIRNQSNFLSEGGLHDQHNEREFLLYISVADTQFITSKGIVLFGNVFLLHYMELFVMDAPRNLTH
jgi:hypothetical protein